MKDIIKKVLNETLDDKNLQMAYVYLSNYMGTLEEIVDEDDVRIYLHEYGDKYAKVCITKNVSNCWVSWQFWKEFSKEFSLEYSEFDLLITRWVENTYELKDINTFVIKELGYVMLKIPTN